MARLLMLVVFTVGTLSQALPRHGTSDNLTIYGGHEISIKEAPFMAALYITRTNNRTYFCGGSIINHKFILTAAHCLRNTYSVLSLSLKGFVGSDNLNGPHRIHIDPEEKFCHDNYDSRDDSNDICLIKLKTPLKLGGKVARVTLPYEKYDLEDGTRVNITGWGFTEDSPTVQNALRQVTVPIKNDCGMNRKSVICTGYEGHSTCQADSGGPVTYGRVLVGVISGGLSQRCGIIGSYHTRVASYVQWIKSIIRHNLH